MEYEKDLQNLKQRKENYLKEAFYNKNKNLFLYKPLQILLFCLLVYYFEFGIYIVIAYIVFKIGIFEQSYYDLSYYATDLEIKILGLNKQIEYLEKKLSTNIENLEEKI